MSNPNAKHDLARIDQIIAGIHAMMARPGSRALTSDQMRARANGLRDIAHTVQLSGQEANQEYL